MVVGMTAGRATRASAAAAAGSAIPTANAASSSRPGPSRSPTSASSASASPIELEEVDQLDDKGALALSTGKGQGSGQLAVARRGESATAAMAGGGDKGPNKSTTRTVPAFLTKLYTMVNDRQADNLIYWSDAGDSFVVASSERFAKELLGHYFKHSNFGSFVRQLNMYGFHKVPHLNQGTLRADVPETEMLEFANPNFQRGQPDLLCLIQRKKSGFEAAAVAQAGAAGSASGSSTARGPGAPGMPNATDWNRILSDLAAIRKHQTVISADLKDLQTSNTHLWQEAMASRDRHKRSQDTINKILGFLAQVFGGKALEEGAEEPDEGVIFEGDGPPEPPPKAGPSAAAMPRPRLPRLLLEDKPRDPSPARTPSTAQTARSRSKDAARVEEIGDDAESRFSEQPTVDDQGRFSTVTDSPPEPAPVPLQPVRRASPKSQPTAPPPTSNSSTTMPPIDDRLLAALLAGSGGQRTPQPYSLAWPSTSTSADAPHDYSTLASLPSPIPSPSRLPAPPPPLSPGGGGDSALTPYRRLGKDTSTISQDVDSLQAAIDQLVRSLPSELQTQVLDSAGQLDNGGGGGGGFANGTGMDWKPSSGVGEGGDGTDLNEFLTGFDGSTSWPATSGGGAPSASGNAGSDPMSPMSSFLAGYGKPTTETQDLDEFDHLWDDPTPVEQHANGGTPSPVTPATKTGGQKREAEGQEEAANEQEVPVTRSKRARV